MSFPPLAIQVIKDLADTGNDIGRRSKSLHDVAKMLEPLGFEIISDKRSGDKGMLTYDGTVILPPSQVVILAHASSDGNVLELDYYYAAGNFIIVITAKTVLIQLTEGSVPLIKEGAVSPDIHTIHRFLMKQRTA